MDLTYQIPSFSYMLDTILPFQSGEQSAFFADVLFRFYPQFDR